MAYGLKASSCDPLRHDDRLDQLDIVHHILTNQLHSKILVAPLGGSFTFLLWMCSYYSGGTTKGITVQCSPSGVSKASSFYTIILSCSNSSIKKKKKKKTIQSMSEE